MPQSVDPISAADRRIWDIPSGSRLTCTKDVVMDSDKTVAFTAGRVYEVVSMHPIADPAYICLFDDQGDPHKMDGNDVATYFGR